MKKLTLVLATLIALNPATLSCEPATPQKPRTFLQRIADHSGKILCGVCALVIGYFLFKTPAQKPAPQPQQPTPPGGPRPPAGDNEGDAFDALEEQEREQRAQRAAEEASDKARKASLARRNDFSARQRELHAKRLARQAAEEQAKLAAARAAQEKADADYAKQVANQPAPPPANSFDSDVDREPLPQSAAVSLFDDVD